MKTVKLRAAVAVDPEGNWNVSGWGTANNSNDDIAMNCAIEGVGDGEARYWLTAEVPVPEVKETEGEVADA
jgi:hypothetical protein